MHVLRRINNNVVLVEREKERAILIGKGIGFKVYPHDKVDEMKVEQVFVPQVDEDLNQMLDILKELPIDVLSVAQKVLANACEELGENLSQNLIMFKKTSQSTILPWDREV